MDILSNKNLVDYVNRVKLMPYDEKIVFLTTSNPEWTINKILFDYYTSNDIILLDGDLLKLIESHRVNEIPREGLSNLDPYEVWYLMKAWKSQQYHRFMCHILNRYINPKNRNKIHPISVEDDSKIECGICWRDLEGFNPNKKYVDTSSLAFTSEGTGTCICNNCLTQLFMFSQLMSLLDDKEFNKLML